MQGFGEQQEQRERAEWERVRWLGSIVMQPHLKKGRKLKPTDLATFPWETESLAHEFDPKAVEANIKHALENSYLG